MTTKKTKRVTIASLQAALPEGALCGEDELEEGGCVFVNAPKWKAWSATGTNSLVAEYHNVPEWNLTRPTAIACLIDDMADGVEDASEDTIHAMGWDETTPEATA
tara:strand:- start:12264 stop:12578 length:315 start_codon:yes stop_codon:yes gene_type:complete